MESELAAVAARAEKLTADLAGENLENKRLRVAVRPLPVCRDR
jgi:hypothetical protein